MDQPLTPTYPVVTSIVQAAASERRVGDLLRRRQRYMLRALEAKAKIDRELAARVRPLEEEVFARAALIEAFASEWRGRLTKDGQKKTVELPRRAGEFSWAFGPPALLVENLKKAIESVRRKGLGIKRFLRVSYDLNKEALLEAPSVVPKVDGAQIIQDERFIIRPANTLERVEKNLRTGSWSINASKKKEMQQ